MHNQNIINLNPTCWWKNKFLYMSITSIIGFLVKLWKYLKIKSMIIWVNIKSGVYYLPPPGLLRPQAEATFCRVTAVSPMLAFYTEPPQSTRLPPQNTVVDCLFWTLCFGNRPLNPLAAVEVRRGNVTTFGPPHWALWER